jgi:SAM-dependent methyltransferase
VCDIDLSTAEVPAQRFDLIMAVMTLHHIPVLEPVLAGFVDLLEPGGHLCVVDLVEEDGSFHEGGDFDGHNGFNATELAKLLCAAGFAESEFAQVYEVAKREKSYPLFLATCRKPG